MKVGMSKENIMSLLTKWKKMKLKQ